MAAVASPTKEKSKKPISTFNTRMKMSFFSLLLPDENKNWDYDKYREKWCSRLSVSFCTDLTDVTLVSEDTYRRPREKCLAKLVSATAVQYGSRTSIEAYKHFWFTSASNQRPCCQHGKYSDHKTERVKKGTQVALLPMLLVAFYFFSFFWSCGLNAYQFGQAFFL